MKKCFFLIYSLLIIGVFLLFSSSCKKDITKNTSGNGGSFTCGEDFTDSRDGSVYSTVQIDNQCWMTENLKYLPSVVGPIPSSETIPYYYVYGYVGTSVSAAKASANYTTYGVLYNWSAAMAGAANSTTNPSGVQGVCPTGWHLPSDAEWTQLTVFLGGESVAGGKLKATGTIEAGTGLWYDPNTGATNESSYTALPGGHRFSNQNFGNVGMNGFWWSATEFSSDNGWVLRISSSFSNVYRINHPKNMGASVRCLKD